jgi:AhpD family alkylhydroperoxidase
MRAKTFLPEAGRSPSGRWEEGAERPLIPAFWFASRLFFVQRRISMPRVNLVDPATATGAAKAPLDEIKGAFGTAPNMFRAVANSPAALKSMWGAFGALGAGAIGAQLGEKIAVAVADRDACSYCLAAHTLLGKMRARAGRTWRMPRLGTRMTPGPPPRFRSR